MVALMVASAAAVAFAAAFLLLGIVPVTFAVVEQAGAGGAAMLDPHLSDDEKEKAVRLAGFSVLGSCAGIAMRLLACLAAAAVPAFTAQWLQLSTLNDVMQTAESWQFLLGSTVALSFAAWLFFQLQPKDAGSAYSSADRLIHNLAFAGPGIQLAAARLEDRILASAWRDVADKPPVFITSLPRAGTTVLLNALHEVPGVATHFYRDMPFVAAPVLWNRFTRPFMRRAKMKERAHGDGLEIGLDSPEAFEDVIWQAFWPDKCKDDHIALWGQDDAYPEAKAFFMTHFRKVIALRTGPGGRYVSKNNGNIARLALLPQMFRDCSIIVPVRTPMEHAASMMRQHENFLRQHDEDPFICRYMRDIGHLEFGAVHVPIAFPGFAPGELAPTSPDYWLSYWIAAYRHVLDRAEAVHIVPQELICARPAEAMGRICELAGLDALATDVEKPFKSVPKRANKAMFTARLVMEAEAIYDELLCRQIVLS